MQAVQQNAQVRIKATKGFFATVAGQFTEVHPGSVVDVPRELAAMMLSCHKAVQVGSEIPLVRADAPVKKPVLDPASERLDKLQATVESLTTLVAKLVEAQAQGAAAKASKEK